MPTSRHRLLWTGPSPSAMLDLRLSGERPDPETIWLVPSALCRQRVLRALAIQSGRVNNPRVWTWDDLWSQVRAREPGEGPAALSEVSAREFLRAAIEQARQDGRLDALGPVTRSAGYRRHLLGQFSDWSRQDRKPGSEPPEGADPAAWAVYERYRRLLETRQAADPALFETWAVRRVPALWNAIADSAPVVVVAPPSLSGPRRALKAIIQRASSVHILMSWEDDADRREVYVDLQGMRDGCRAFGFEAVEHGLPSDRPEGLRALQQTLFREPEPPVIERTEGLTLLGSPQGDASALRIARVVQDRLDDGEAPEEILILFPRWSDLGDRTLEALSEAGIPAWSTRRRLIANDPTVSALRLVLNVAAEGWESASLASLLRLGPIRLEGFSHGDLASAASAIRRLRVFRGLDAIRTRLGRESVLDPQEKDLRTREKAHRAGLAIRVVDALARTYEGLEPRASWNVRLDQLRDLLRWFSLSSRALDQLLAALRELGETREWLGTGAETWPWPAFSREVLALARDLTEDPPSEPSGSVRLALVSEAAGARAHHVVLAGLEEGSFPDAEGIGIDPDRAGTNEGEPSKSECAHAREMRRFLSVLEIATRTVTLAYPTTDEKGVRLLPAGFLDDVRRRLSPEAAKATDDVLRRLDPIVPEPLALAAAERRVRAVGLACLEEPGEGLPAVRTLASSPEHREALLGTARALRVAAERRRRRKFGRFEGDLHTSGARTGIAREFSPDRPAPFSASQLETLANCPFQFFLRHVLKLEPTEEPEELDEDYTARGQLIHASLQEMHDVLRGGDGAGVSLAALVHEVVELYIERGLEGLLPPSSDVDEGLRAIESERLRRTGRRYARQFEEYQAKLSASCQGCEVEFGRPGSPFPPLRLGDEADGVGLQGIIDRIDTLNVDGLTLFRVIDYKTGACPSRGDLKAGLALQLPLYALAVERIILAGEHAEPFDVGYWELRNRGFKAVDQRIKVRKKAIEIDEQWPENLRAVEAFVVDLVKRLRAAEFPVAPRREDCTSTCEYKNVCRIGQVKTLNKSWDDAPSLKRST